MIAIVPKSLRFEKSNTNDTFQLLLLMMMIQLGFLFDSIS